MTDPSAKPRGARTEPSALAIAGSMAFLAGATDVYGLLRLRDVFVSFMSGNTTMLGVALGRGDWARAVEIASIVGLFVIGAALGSVLAMLSGSRHATAVTAATAIMLSVPLAIPAFTSPSLVLAMGVLNAAMHQAGAAGVSLTFVTGALVKFGRGLGQLISGRPGDLSWLANGLLWLCLLSGAVGATVVQALWGHEVLWPLPALAALIAAGTLARRTPLL